MGHYEEGRYQEEQTSGEGVDRGRPDAFHTLEISDYSDIDNIKNEAGGHQGHAGRGDAVAVGAGAEEERGNVFHSEGEGGREEDSGTEGGEQGDFAGFHYPAPFAGAVVVADNRLRGLRDGIARHEDERHDVAGDGERSHAILAQVSHKHVVTGEHQDRYAALSEESGEAETELITDVSRE